MKKMENFTFLREVQNDILQLSPEMPSYFHTLNVKVTETVSPKYSSSFIFGMNPTRFILFNLVNQLDQHHIPAQSCISRINAYAFLGIFLYGLLLYRYVCLDNSSIFLCLSPTPRQVLVNSLLLFIVYFYLTQTLYYYFLYFSPVMLSHDILGFLALGSYSLYLSSLSPLTAVSDNMCKCWLCGRGRRVRGGGHA